MIYEIIKKIKILFLKNLKEVTSKIGFFYLINSGIDKNLNEKLFKLGKDFLIFLEVRKSLFLWYIPLNLEIIQAKALNIQQGIKSNLI